MDTHELWFWTAGLAITSGACFFGIFRNLKRTRIIEDTPTSKIRSAAQGYVELIGTCQPGELGHIDSELGGVPCLWYRFTIEEYRNNKNGGNWVTIEKGESSHWFRVKDETGECAIDPQGAEVRTKNKRVWQGHEKHPRKHVEKGFLGSLFKGKYRYSEYLLFQHEPLYAIGFFQSLNRPGLRTPTDDQVTQLLKDWKADKEALLARFDHNDDGQIDLNEWQYAVNAAQAEINSQARTNAPRQSVSLLSKPIDKAYPFILATDEQKNLAGHYRLWAGLCVAGFLGALGGTIFLVTQLF